jgi:hypothetical protein
MSSQCVRNSSARRDFPIPGSPMSSTSVPKPIRTGATDAASTARSRSRSTNGSLSAGTSPVRSDSGSRSPSTTARTASAFPFTWNGSSSVAANDPPPRENASAATQISSSPARAINRAASAAVSPRIVYVRRNGAPT